MAQRSWKLILYLIIITIIIILVAVFWKDIKTFFELAGIIGTGWALASLGSLVADIIGLIVGGVSGVALWISSKTAKESVEKLEEEEGEVTEEAAENIQANTESLRETINEVNDFDPGSGIKFQAKTESGETIVDEEFFSAEEFYDWTDENLADTLVESGAFSSESLLLNAIEVTS